VSGLGLVTQTVNFKDVVLELKVTPTITNDGRVFLNMAVKKDELEEFISIPPTVRCR
jgi:type IV pilus assembly protein PilQ